jgi:hypothetical protein
MDQTWSFVGKAFLWSVGIFFILGAIGQFQSPSSGVGIPLLIAGLVLLPPVRARSAGYLPPIRTMFIVLVGFGTFAAMSGGEKLKPKDAAQAVADSDARAKAEAVAAEEQRKKDAACKAELQCWAEKHHIAATIACRPRIERLSKWQFEWTDGWLESKFSRFKWKDQAKGLVVYVGDRIKFQNGFGAWQYAVYKCVYDPTNDAVLDVEALPGRLPD